MKNRPVGGSKTHDEVNSRFSQICERALKKLLKRETANTN
jgi:hypothetical protein